MNKFLKIMQDPGTYIALALVTGLVVVCIALVSPHDVRCNYLRSYDGMYKVINDINWAEDTTALRFHTPEDALAALERLGTSCTSNEQ